MYLFSSGSSGRVRGGAEKHEIYAAAFSGHPFYDLFSQGRGGHGPLGPPGSATAITKNLVNNPELLLVGQLLVVSKHLVDSNLFSVGQC